MSRTLDPNIQYEYDGKPVVGGKAYYGVANQDPKLNPIAIYGERTLSTPPLINPQDTDDQGRVENPIYVGVNEYSYLVEDILGNQISFQPLLEPLNTLGLVTQDPDLNGFKFINVGDAVANDQFATLGQSNIAYAQTITTDISSTPDAIVANLPLPPLGLVDDFRVVVKLTHGKNTLINPTFKLNGFAPKTIYRGANEALIPGDTKGVDNYLHLAYNGGLDAWCLINTDTQGIIDQNVDMDGFKFTNVADATANDEFVSLGQANKSYIQAVNSDVSSAPDAIVALISPALASLSDKQPVIVCLQHGPNTITTPTLDLGFGAKIIYRDSNQPLRIGDTVGQDNCAIFVYDAVLDKFQILNAFYPGENSVGNFQVAVGTLNGDRITPGTLPSGSIAAGSIGSAELANNIIDENKMRSPTVGNTYVIKRLVPAGTFVETSNDSYPNALINRMGASDRYAGFTCLQDGAATLRFTLRAQGANPVKARILKNSVQLGAEFDVSVNTQNTFTANLTFSLGDHIELQWKTTGVFADAGMSNVYITSGVKVGAIA